MTQPEPITARLAACLPEFKDQAHLDLALTHASTDGASQNERMEFLGDTVLDLIVAEFLYHQFPDRAEGELTQMKAALVSRATLAEVARDLGLAGHAQVGGGLKSSNLSRAVLANLFEAVVGAVYLDQGLAAAEAFIECSMGNRLRSNLIKANEPVPKQQLQEYSQRSFGKPPRYKVIETRGQAHARAFLVSAVVNHKAFPTAWGRTIKEAESWAAFEAMLVLGDSRQDNSAQENSTQDSIGAAKGRSKQDPQDDGYEEDHEA